MEKWLPFVVPGYFQWKNQQRFEACLWMAVGFAGLGAVFLGLFVADDSIELKATSAYFGNAIPALPKLLQAVGLAFFGASGLLALIDFKLKNSAKTFTSSKTSNLEKSEINLENWQTFSATYLKADYPATLSSLEEELKKSKNDPYLHYLKARCFTYQDLKPLALKSLKEADKCDKHNELSWEREQLRELLNQPKPEGAPLAVAEEKS